MDGGHTGAERLESDARAKAKENSAPQLTGVYMGKGDRRTRRGKLSLGTYGNRRPRKKKKDKERKEKEKKGRS
jgi:ribosomal small subunit protein bTHX